MSAAPAVEFCGVAKTFRDGSRALDDVTFTIPRGRFVALLGPSGCGKTTSLRLINRLETPTGGEVRVRGKSVVDYPQEELRRSIGYVIQDAGLFPHFTISANVATVPKLLGWPAAKIRDRVREVLDLVGLPEAKYGNRLPHQLSGGQRQRVGVARGLAADPDILLMDEPFGALDPGTRATVQDEFLKLQETLHKTIVMVTHDMAEAGKMADEIVLLVSGKVVQKGSLRDILLQPAGPLVRDFLGGQGHHLALEALRLESVLDSTPRLDNVTGSLRLPATVTLGQTLVTLADAATGSTVTIDDGTYDAVALRQRIVADLRHAADGGGAR
jgi:osmoprotectant transport system ATP-binding protein